MDGTLLGMGAGADSGGNEVSNRNVSAIVEDLKRYGLDIDAHLSRDDLADMTAYASMVESQLVPATLWAIWGDNESFSHYTQVRCKCNWDGQCQCQCSRGSESEWQSVGWQSSLFLQDFSLLI